MSSTPITRLSAIKGTTTSEFEALSHDVARKSCTFLTNCAWRDAAAAATNTPRGVGTTGMRTQAGFKGTQKSSRSRASRIKPRPVQIRPGLKIQRRQVGCVGDEIALAAQQTFKVGGWVRHRTQACPEWQWGNLKHGRSESEKARLDMARASAMAGFRPALQSPPGLLGGASAAVSCRALLPAIFLLCLFCFLVILARSFLVTLPSAPGLVFRGLYCQATRVRRLAASF